ncbi:TPA: hypothetical protein HA243_06600, partial [Candidatus Micrarchaeota archaeon]|nr:hypothetical protein [Candidatus Micrarchaeota archaeon]
MRLRGQGASEYLLILAFMLIVSITVVYFISDLSGAQTSISQAESATYWGHEAAPYRISEATHILSLPCPIEITENNSGYVFVLTNADEKETVSLTGVSIDGVNRTFCLLGRDATTSVPIDPGKKVAISINYTKDCRPGKPHEIAVNFSYSKGDFDNRTQVGTKKLVLNCNDQSALSLYIFTSSLPNGTCNSEYPATQLEARWSNGQPASASWQATGLPEDFTLSPQGVLSGNPCNSSESVPLFLAVAGTSMAQKTIPLSVGGTDCYCGAWGFFIINSVLPNGNIQIPYNATLTAVNGTPPYIWSVIEGALPTSIALDSVTGNLSGTPSEIGNFTFLIKATDNVGLIAQKQFTVTINSLELTITNSLENGNVGVPYNQTMVAIGGEQPYSWSVSGSLPDNLTLNPATGEITGTPSAIGSFNFTIYVYSSDNVTSSKAFTVSVANDVYILTSSLPVGREWYAYNYDLTAAGGSPPYNWTQVAGQMDLCLSLKSTGRISAAPGESSPCDDGIYNFTARATDQMGNSHQKDFILQIDKKMYICDSMSNAVVGIPYSELVDVCNDNGYSLNWSLYSGTPPPGLWFSTGVQGSPNYGGVLQGTPTQAGTYDDTFRVKVQDALGYTDTEYIAIFISNSSFYIIENSLSSGCLNESYTVTIHTTGGSSPYNWSITSGSVPPGLTLEPSTSSSIKLKGTPTTTGTYGFTVRVVDNGGASAEKTYSVYIANCVDNLDIDSDNFPNGYIGTPYQDTEMDASGGNPPYTWSVSSGSLPAGLSLSSGGIVSGTPAGPAGTSSFGIRVTDEDGQNYTEPFSIIIYSSSLIITTS